MREEGNLGEEGEACQPGPEGWEAEARRKSGVSQGREKGYPESLAFLFLLNPHH